MKKISILVGIFLAIFLTGIGTALAFYNNKTAPRTIIGKIEFGNLSKNAFEKKLKKEIQLFEKKPISFIYQGKGVLVKPSDMAAVWDEKAIAQKIHFQNIAKDSLIAATFRIIGGQKIPATAKFDYEKTAQELKKNFEITNTDNKNPSQNAQLIWNGKSFTAEEKPIEKKFDEKLLKKEIQNRLENFSNDPVILVEKEFSSKISKEDLEKNLENIKPKLLKTIVVTSGRLHQNISLKDHLDWIAYEKEKKIIASSETFPKEIQENIKLNIDEVSFKKFLQENFAKNIEKLPTAIKIFTNEKKKIVFDGKGETGMEIAYEEAQKLINLAANSMIKIVELPVRTIPNEVQISEDLQALGIKELISEGYTTYYGSPTNRMYNIQNGISKFNGILIKPGETFSFNKILGPVDGSTGYRKELVIKPEGTIPEYGGGICQVSTTMYRGALLAGLPIVERKPHSYVVSYYSQVLGHGIDATIYPGASDLKFINDTPGHILIQGYSEGAEAHFKFYGTNDGRKVSLEGPQISNARSAGATEIIKTTQLAVGAKKQVERAHNGFDTLWYRIITTASGETKKEEIVSKYKAIPARILVGAAAEEIQPGEANGEQYFRD